MQGVWGQGSLGQGLCKGRLSSFNLVVSLPSSSLVCPDVAGHRQRGRGGGGGAQGPDHGGDRVHAWIQQPLTKVTLPLGLETVLSDALHQGASAADARV